MSFCCFWLGCWAAEFGSSGGTYELFFISILAFITQVEFAYGAFRFKYIMGEHVTTGQRVITHIYVWTKLRILFIYSDGFSAVEHGPN
jgi:hypothetical protein